tara:strand:- start:945 stop:1127 length:183 start_codon:yes stop_codon:yes gene_type:complete
MKKNMKSTDNYIDSMSEKELTGFNDAHSYLMSSPSNKMAIDKGIKDLKEGRFTEISIKEL